jgi:hypothetical protein
VHSEINRASKRVKRLIQKTVQNFDRYHETTKREHERFDHSPSPSGDRRVHTKELTAVGNRVNHVACAK